MSILNLQYKMGIKRQVIQSFRKVYLDPSFPEPDLANKINFELQYPIIQERYPAIYVTYTDHVIKDSGLGNYYYTTNPDGTTGINRQWYFEGSINLNIMALDPIERDELAASVINIMAFGKDDPLFYKFREYIVNEEFVSLQPLLSSISGGEEVVVATPWGSDNELVYSTVYSFMTAGSFYTDPDHAETSGIVTIDEITTYPYRDNQAVPTGDTSGDNAEVEWQ